MSKYYDIVVVGGGIHGVGVAQAGAAAGYEVLLLEQEEIAAATSSRSSKLIHGGLRYLESGQFSLIRESLREREILLRTAPGLVHLVPFYIPVYETNSRRPWQIRTGLSLYALLGNLRSAARFRHLPRRQWDRLDGLRTEGLRAVYQYWDAQTDDRALSKAVMRSAQDLGAELRCPARFLQAQSRDKLLEVSFSADGGEQHCHCRVLVNAAGAWVNEVLEHLTPRPSQRAVELVQGSHILVPGELKWGIYYVESPRDRRAVLIMPWQDKLLVGTTEMPYTGDPAAVKPLPQEIDYLKETLQHYFPGRDAEVLDSFAGLRVLPKGQSAVFHRPRETLLHRDPRSANVISVYGGKLTAYRATALKVIKLIRPLLPARGAIADTACLPLRA